MLNPVQPASLETQADRAVLKSRAALIEVRTKLINSVRGTLKSFGLRLKASSGHAFVSKAGPRLPGDLRETLAPVLEVVQHVSDEIQCGTPVTGQIRHGETAPGIEMSLDAAS